MKTIVKRLALMFCCAGLFLASCSDDGVSDAQRALMEVIREAETLIAEVEEGTSEGDIAPGSKKTLQARIDQAYFIMNSLPVIIVYLLLSKFIVRGVALGGVKG